MEQSAVLWSLATLFTSILSGALCALAAWRWASRSTPRRKPSNSPEPNENFAAALAQLQADQAALFSTLEKLTTTVKRLSSRNGMRELREERMTSTHEAPPVGASKADLRRHYGLAGKGHADIARIAQNGVAPHED